MSTLETVAEWVNKRGTKCKVIFSALLKSATKIKSKKSKEILGMWFHVEMHMEEEAQSKIISIIWALLSILDTISIVYIY